LQDAQGRAGQAQARLDQLRSSGRATDQQLRNAEEALARANRATEVAQLRLGAAHERNAAAAQRAAEAARRLEEENNRVGDSADKAKKPIMGLVGALGLIAPAAVPIAAVAGGAILGLIPAAATALLGIKGIGDELKSGALEGTSYGRSIKTVSDEFGKLKAIAAGGLLDGINRAVAQSSPLFHVLNTDVQIMSTQLGNIVAGAAPALLSILTQLNPLFVTFGNLLSTGAQQLEGWASSTTGISSFVQYVQAVLPQVAQFLGNLVVMFSHVVQAVAPFGSTVLSALNGVVTAINHIPVGVLQTLVPLLAAAYLGFVAFKGVSVIIDAISAAMVRLRATSATFASVAPLIAGLAIGIGLLALAFGHSSSQTQAATKANQEYAESVKASTNALNEANLKATAKNLSDSHALDQLNLLTAGNKDLGLSFGDLTQAVNGSQSSFNSTIGKLKELAQAHIEYRNTAAGYGSTGVTVKGYDDEGRAALSLVKTLTGLRGSLASNIKQQEAYNEAQRQAVALSEGGNAAAHANAARLGLTSRAYLDAQVAADKNRASIEAQTAAMRVAGDAAGLLQQALDGLAGTNLSVAQARTSLAAANLAVNASFKENGRVIRGSSAAAVANQQAIQGNVTAARNLAEAIAKQTSSSRAGVQSFKASKRALEDDLRAHHNLTPAIQKTIDKLYQIKNLKVPPTKVDVDVAQAHKHVSDMQRAIDAIRQGKVPELNTHTGQADAAVGALQKYIDAVQQHKVPSVNVADHATSILQQVQAYLDGLRDKTINLTTVTHSVNVGTGPAKAHLASGGPVRGPGGPRDDKAGLYALSNGEFVSTAAATGRNQAALEAANRGATLTVAGFAKGGKVGAGTMSGAQTASGAQVYHVGKGWGFQGQYYDKRKDADAARRDYLRQQRSDRIYQSPEEIADLNSVVQRTSTRGGASTIADVLKMQLPDVKAAMRKLSQVTNDAFELKAVEKKIDAAKAKLADMKSFRDSVMGTVAGQTDLSKSGSVGDLLTQIGHGKNLSDRYGSEVNKLRGEAKGNKTLLDFVNQQAAQGNTTTLDTLAHASKGDLANITKALAGYDTSLLGAGNAATTTKYGKSITQQQAAIGDLVGQQKAWIGRIDRLVAQIARVTRRPVQVQIDGKTIASAVIHDRQFEGVIDELSHTVHYGRKKGH
jgi:hypothetical protein